MVLNGKLPEYGTLKYHQEMKTERDEFKNRRTSKLEQAVVALQASIFCTE